MIRRMPVRKIRDVNVFISDLRESGECEVPIKFTKEFDVWLTKYKAWPGIAVEEKKMPRSKKYVIQEACNYGTI